jgi:hypothetical protein
MFTWQSLLKCGYVLALGTTIWVLSQPAPVRAQRGIAYPFLPGAMTNMLGMGALAGQSGPLNSYTHATTMLMQAQQALDPFGVGQTGGMGLLGGMGQGGTGFGGGNMGMMGMGGGMRGGMGGMMGMGGGMMGMGGMRGGFGGGMMGMGGGFAGGGGFGGMNGGFGGMGGFAGKGFGGFSGRKAL